MTERREVGRERKARHREACGRENETKERTEGGMERRKDGWTEERGYRDMWGRCTDQMVLKEGKTDASTYEEGATEAILGVKLCWY